jgi:superfamily II DNA helicase RecQ
VRMPDVGDRVRLWGGLEGAVTGVADRQIEVTLDSGAEMTVGPTDVVRVTAVATTAGDVDPGLVAALKEWRREISQRLGVPAYVVLHDKTIDEIVRRRPATERQLLQIAGIGPAKLENYGDDILATVAGASE